MGESPFEIRYIHQKKKEFPSSVLFHPITLKGRRATTDDYATAPFHLILFSVALVELAKSIPVYSFILPSHFSSF